MPYSFISMESARICHHLSWRGARARFQPGPSAPHDEELALVFRLKQCAWLPGFQGDRLTGKQAMKECLAPLIGSPLV
jgi:hypothetical protein